MEVSSAVFIVILLICVFFLLIGVTILTKIWLHFNGFVIKEDKSLERSEQIEKEAISQASQEPGASSISSTGVSQPSDQDPTTRSCQLAPSYNETSNDDSQRNSNSSSPNGVSTRETGIIENLIYSYGFIQCCERQEQLLFHFSQYSGNIEHLKLGDAVEFERTYDLRTGEPIASSVCKMTFDVGEVTCEERVPGFVSTENKDNTEVKAVDETVKNRSNDRMKMTELQEADIKYEIEDYEKKILKLSLEIETEKNKNMSLATDVRFYRKAHSDAEKIIQRQKEDFQVLYKQIEDRDIYSKKLVKQRKNLQVQLKNSSEQLQQVEETVKRQTKTIEELAKMFKIKDDNEEELIMKTSVLKEEIKHLNDCLSKNKDTFNMKLIESEANNELYQKKINQLEQELKEEKWIVSRKMEDMKRLNVKIQEITKEKSLMENKVNIIENERKEIAESKRELQELRIKSKQDEIQRPFNFNRWHFLEGTKPDPSLLKSKLESLTEQLIQKNAEADALKVMLREQEQLVERLRKMLEQNQGF